MISESGPSGHGGASKLMYERVWRVLGASVCCLPTAKVYPCTLGAETASVSGGAAGHLRGTNLLTEMYEEPWRGCPAQQGVGL